MYIPYNTIDMKINVYDVSILVIPLLLALGGAVGAFTEVPTEIGVGVSGLASLAVLVYVLFVVPPTDSFGSRSNSPS